MKKQHCPPTRYHIAIPLQLATVMMEKKESLYLKELPWHLHRAKHLRALGAKHYSSCPQVTREGLCGCQAEEREWAVIPPLLIFTKNHERNQ